METVYDGGSFAVMDKPLATSAKSSARPRTPSTLLTVDRCSRRDVRDR